MRELSWDNVDGNQVVPCRLVISLEGCQVWPSYPKWHLDALTLVLSPELCVSDYKGFDMTREALLAMACTPSVRSQCERMKIQVCVTLLFTKERPMNQVLTHLNNMGPQKLPLENEDSDSVVREEEVEEEEDDERREYPFQVGMVDFIYEENNFARIFVALQTELTKTTLRYFPLLAKGGDWTFCWVRFMDFMDASFGDDSRQSALVGDYVRVITAAPAGIAEKYVYTRGIQILEMVTTSGTIDALFSGLMHSRGVEQVTPDEYLGSADAREYQVKWQWVMYSLFHASATHSIQSLRICNEDIIPEHIHYVREFLQAPLPLEVIYNSIIRPSYRFGQTKTLPSGLIITLAKLASIYFHWNPQSDDMYLRASSSATHFRVIGSPGDMICISSQATVSVGYAGLTLNL